MKRRVNMQGGRPGVLRVGGALVLAAALLLSSCGGGDDTPSAAGGGPKDEVRLLLNWVPDAARFPHLYGIEHGIFEKHGIELELIPGKGSGFAMEQINEDKFDFVQSDFLSYVASRAEHDSPTTAVMSFMDEATAGLMSLQPIDSVDDLVGKDIAIEPFDAMQFILPVVLAENGLPPDSWKIKLVDTAGFQVLLEKRVDAISVFKTGSLAIGQLAAERFDEEAYFLNLADFGLAAYPNVIVARNEVLESDPDLVQRLVAAFQESAERSLEASDDEVFDLVSAVSPELDRETTLLQWEQTKEILTADGAFDTEIVETNLGYVSDALEIDHDLQPEDVFTNEFVSSE